MRSVGPFLLTDAEFAGLEIQLREDEREQRKIIAAPGRLTVRFWFNNGRPNHARNQVDLETGESGETAEVEAESAAIERDLRLLTKFNYSTRNW